MIKMYRYYASCHIIKQQKIIFLKMKLGPHRVMQRCSNNKQVKVTTSKQVKIM